MPSLSDKLVFFLRHFHNKEIPETELRDFAMKLGMYACTQAHEVESKPVAIGVDHRGKSYLYPGDPNEFLLSGDSRIGHAARIVITDVSQNLVSIMMSTETGNMFYRNLIRHWDERTRELKGYAEQWMQLKWGEPESGSIMASRLRNLKEYLNDLIELEASEEAIKNTRMSIDVTVDKLDRLYGRDPIIGGKVSDP